MKTRRILGNPRVMQLLFAALALRGFACSYKRQYAVPLTSETKHPVSEAACEAACRPFIGKLDGCSIAEKVEDCDYVESSEKLVDKANKGKDSESKPNGFVVCNLKMNPAACGAGRLSASAAPLAFAGETLAARLSALADLEATAIVAFDELADELTAHSAPLHLVERALRAREDETRHAREMKKLARANGAHSIPRAVDKSPVRSLLDLAELNATEGCVRETFGAFVALHAASAAEDANVRATMEPIARDELDHALLSWDVHAWALARLDPRDRHRIEDAMRASAHLLSRSIDAQIDREWQRVLGEPSAELSADAFERLAPLWS